MNARGRLMSVCQLCCDDWPSRLIFCTFGLLAILTVSIYIFVYLKAGRELNALGRDLAQVQRAYYEGQSLKSRAELAREYIAVLDTYGQRLSKPYSSSAILNEISAALTKSGLNVIDESYTRPQARDGLVRSQVRLAVSGTYQQVRSFAYSVDEMSHFAQLVKITIDKKNSALVSEMNIDIYALEDSRGRL